MKLKEYLDNLNKMVKDNPELLEMNVIYSRDDEGNGFQEVYFTPTLGIFKDGEFYSNEADFEEYGLKPDDKNAICIN